ncbi:DUF6044 family protein [Methanogenium marinum]|uniref:DUF6044 family protein n=1 Tax=Methanogenium marinum TaxID=348610 RepID=A0A9Q4KRG0_9EURY|nr:DUF6044 family protein [Methanogenium marinum]MDE4907322.1 DUF6044 family protein [Methanogenium marinum]
MEYIKFCSEHKYFICAFFILSLYLAPFYILGDTAPTLIHDNLDSNIVWYTILADSGQSFGLMDATIPQLMNGIPRNSFGSEYSVIQCLFQFFEPYTAYIINLTLMHLFAFIGMYLLLSRHLLSHKDSIFITVGVSLAFALLPFWPSGGLSIAGMPLLLYAFLNIRNNQWKITDWAIIGLMPFYSSFALTGFFVLAALVLFWLYDLFHTRKPNYAFFLAICLVCLMYCLVEYRLLYSMFFDTGYVSMRTEMIRGAGSTDFWSAIAHSKANFIYGQYHAVSLHKYVIGLSVACAFLVLLFKRKRCDLLILLVGLCAVISLFYGFAYSDLLSILQNIPLYNSFSIIRFHFLHPLLWFIIFALALKIIYSNIQYGRQIAVIFLILQIGFLFSLGSVGNINTESYQCGGLGLLQTEQLSFDEFYSPELFAEINDSIQLPRESYRIVSIGMHPAISQYNGFYTLDMYHVNYPLSYKHSFRLIIEKELGKNENHQECFDTWGGRCYIFVSELDGNSMYTRDINGSVQNLEINSQVLYDMGGRYIFSAVDIQNYQENNLDFIGTFERDDSPWKIRVYSVKKPADNTSNSIISSADDENLQNKQQPSHPVEHPS